ncbi:MAG: hypothetical protein VW268_02895 [Rhodospirillaceae bacterium]
MRRPTLVRNQKHDAVADTPPDRQEILSAAMLRWMLAGWNGAVWFVGVAAERAIVRLFLLPTSPYPMQISRVMGWLFHLTEWMMLGIFIWWCVSVWRCADREGLFLWPQVAKTVVVILVIAQATVALSRLSH